MRKGRRIAIDVGTVRIGLAVSDDQGILASPLPFTTRSSEVSATVMKLVDVAQKYEAIEIYVGEPIALDGLVTQSTVDARGVAQDLAKMSNIPVRLIDERFTTVSASSKLRDAGVNSKDAKSLIDSASAVEILENALHIERRTGRLPGQLVGDSVGA